MELAQGRTVGEIAAGSRLRRRLSAVGGLKAGQACRLKELERENSRLKRAVAELMLDKQILKGVGHCATQEGELLVRLFSPGPVW